MANAVEGAVSTPARKAASFSAGVQGAVSSFMRRDKGAPPAASTDSPPWTPPVTEPVGEAGTTAADATENAAADTADAAAAAAPESDPKV
jgi:hypothetical protein